MRGSIPAPALILVFAAACASSSGRPRLLGGGASKALSYAQLHSLRRGTPARAILEAFGKPEAVVRSEARIAALVYPCENYRGEVYSLRILFDREERLQTWRLKAPNR